MTTENFNFCSHEPDSPNLPNSHWTDLISTILHISNKIFQIISEHCCQWLKWWLKIDGWPIYSQCWILDLQSIHHRGCFGHLSISSHYFCMLYKSPSHCMFFLVLSSDHEFCPLIFFLKRYFLNLINWISNVHALISMDRASYKILFVKKSHQVYCSDFFKSNTKINISSLRMRSQGCSGCQKFWKFVLKTNLLVFSANIQLKVSKLSKYGQKQWFFRSFYVFFMFFQFWLNLSASNCQNLIWHETFDL